MERKPVDDGFLCAAGTRPANSFLSRGEPVTRVERAAHAQGERRDIDELVGRHFSPVGSSVAVAVTAG